MKLKILGSGATQPIPRPCCSCAVCEEARKKGKPYSRKGCALFIQDTNSLFDTPPDVYISLNEEGVKKVESVFYTHHHPDHIYGSKVFEMINMDWPKEKPIGSIDVYLPEGVKERIRKVTDEIEYSEKVGLLKTHVIEKPVKIKGIEITPFLTESKQNVYGFIITEGQKKVIYCPCDTQDFPESAMRPDLAIAYLGYIDEKNKNPSELTMGEIVSKLREIGAKRIILTHIEENRQKSHDELKKLGKKINVEFAFDGMEIAV